VEIISAKAWQRAWRDAWLTRSIEERFLHFADRLLRRSEGEENASACFGRNDRFGVLEIDREEEESGFACADRNDCIGFLDLDREEEKINSR
jgi:hypothetical protein